MLSCCIFSFLSCVASYHAALTFFIWKTQLLAKCPILPAASYTKALGVVGSVSYYSWIISNAIEPGIVQSSTLFHQFRLNAIKDLSSKNYKDET